MASIRNYLSLVKLSHTIFALPFAFIGFLLGVVVIHDMSLQESQFWILLLKIILCMVFARTAAMAFNRYIDRNIDAKNERTRSREIPSGVISSAATIVLVILSSVLFIITTYYINSICFQLSPIALLVVLGYSFSKRFTWLCHFILGLGLSLAPIGAYLAVTGKFDLIPILFSFTVLTWVGGFDIIYALQDEDFDREQKLYSIPAWIGKKGALRVSEFVHLLSAFCVIKAGTTAHFGFWYWVGAIIFIALLIYQHILVKPDDLSRVNLAFFTTNGIASLVFFVFVAMELL